MNIAVLPGFLGTQLHDLEPLRPFVQSLVWINKFRILNGALAYLDLAPDGTSPGPLAKGVQLRRGDPEPSLYGPLMDYLRDQGHVVEGIGWDWRQDIRSEGERVAATCLVLFKGEPFALVAHSAGGLVARVTVARMKARDKYDLVKKVVFLGTPQWGTLYSVAALCRQSDTYKSLVTAVGGHTQAGKQSVQAVIDPVLAHLVCIYQLLPAWGYGPYWTIDPDFVSRLYDADFWAGVTPYVTQQRLDNARETWTALKDLVYPEKSAYIYGKKRDTPSNYAWDKKLVQLIEAVFAATGDDTVELQSALPPDVQLAVGSTEWSHQQLPAIGDVQKSVQAFLSV